MSNGTAPDLSGEWHPTWCCPESFCDTDVTPSDRHHQSELELFPTTKEDDFAVVARWEAFGTPGDEYPIEYDVEVVFKNIANVGHEALLYMPASRLRDLADWLNYQADRLDASAEGQRPAGDPE